MMIPMILPREDLKIMVYFEATDDFWLQQGTGFWLLKNLNAALKQGNPVTHHHMDDPWGSYAKWNKPISKDKYCKSLLLRGV